MIHPTSHVSMLQKYMLDPSYILARQAIQLDEYLSYEEEPRAIIGQQVKKLHSKEMASVKVICMNHSREEAT